ncbi:hypothetical protein EPIR_1367 [Erwinia piriflorinigrans CFBP 5888]|uniref:Uncharacterized protein n=1 Tax=Erwinia piriflorinigrans CFBP 5888 TaxID=1161919 RepID=V5Z719_9GAMM|nr:hypothetical protein EPIR_1367 [Erwinia piriflorinigrans CFBP 5888]
MKSPQIKPNWLMQTSLMATGIDEKTIMANIQG